MRVPFLYFDLGKVIVDFSFRRMLEQMAAVAGISVEAVREAIFGGRLLLDYEIGQLSTREFYDAFCRASGTCPSFESLCQAAADIFWLNPSMLPIVAHLRQAGYPMGILSNTSEIHWGHCWNRYRIVAEGFRVHALSFRIGTAKPEAAIFHAAAELAGYRPDEIFFTDDLPENIAGAKAAGFDAVQFTTASALVRELRQRGIRFNY